MKNKIILLKTDYNNILNKKEYLDEKVDELTNLIESFYRKQIIDENELISEFIENITKIRIKIKSDSNILKIQSDEIKAEIKNIQNNKCEHLLDGGKTALKFKLNRNENFFDDCYVCEICGKTIFK